VCVPGAIDWHSFTQLILRPYGWTFPADKVRATSLLQCREGCLLGTVVIARQWPEGCLLSSYYLKVPTTYTPSTPAVYP
jgi:hypothetical protein